MGDGEEAIRRERAVSRRELIRRGAVVGGTLIWATPAIQSLATPAFAQATPAVTHVCCFCTGDNPAIPGAPSPSTQCFENGFPPDLIRCQGICASLGYDPLQSQFDSSTVGACDCHPVTGCVNACP